MKEEMIQVRRMQAMDEFLRQISDGRLYELNDLVKVGCHDCEGCSECCRGMGDTILLDPYDVYRLSKGLNKSVEELLEQCLELHNEEGLILPNLKMSQETDACTFLNEQGRCSIHEHRPGICRLFPLGRNYEEDHLNYFLLKDECKVKSKTKMKVIKWLSQDNIKDYQQYLVDWHNLTKAMRQEVLANEDETYRRQTTMLFLQLFFIKPYKECDFYKEFYERRDMLV